MTLETLKETDTPAFEPITHLLPRIKNRKTAHGAVRYKTRGRWKRLTWAQHSEVIKTLGHGLMSSGVEPGDRVAIVSNTRVEWLQSDLAILGIGAITVPIYHSQRPEDIAYILNDCQAETLICEDSKVLKKWTKISSQCPNMKRVFCISCDKDLPEEIKPWSQLLDLGQEHESQNPGFFDERCLNTQIDDVATILYTSGTTGHPKGVVLTYRQIASEVIDVFSILGVLPDDISLTFLPYAHILGRVEAWGHIVRGYTLAFAESIERIKNNLKEIQPTVMIAVPRIFEKIYNGILAQVETSPSKMKLFQWALASGTKVSQYKRRRQPIPFYLLAKYRVAKALVFSKVTNALGGRLRFALCGGAPLGKELAEFFHAADILILEGYGLTETTAAVSVNTPLHYRFGTVGHPLPDVQIKIADDGEILIRSDKVMKEYYKNELATKKAIVDGYFATGDIGHLDEDGYLCVTDRKKDLIKTAGGKYVAPQRLEKLLKMSPYISNILIHGDKRKYIVALITLDSDNLSHYVQEKGIELQTNGATITDTKVRSLIKSEIATANEKLASFETIKNFTILKDDFSIEKGELTPSLKVKRRFCDEKYKDLIDQLYGVDQSSL